MREDEKNEDRLWLSSQRRETNESDRKIAVREEKARRTIKKKRATFEGWERIRGIKLKPEIADI